MNGYTIDLTQIAEAIITILFAVISLYLIPWIKSRTTASQQEYIRAAAHVAVYAAEKFWGAGHGDEKLEYATKVLKEDYGITLNLNKLEAVIDAAIKEMEQAEPPKLITGEMLEGVLLEEDGEGEGEEEEPQREDAPEGA